jgi:hypothetical protein
MILEGRTIQNIKSVIVRNITVESASSETGTIKLKGRFVEVIKDGNELTSKVPVWKVK